MPRRNKPLKKLRKLLGKLWARISEWPKGVAFWVLETAEDWLIEILEAVHRCYGRLLCGRNDWDD